MNWRKRLSWPDEGGGRWWVRVESRTHAPDGKRHSFKRYVPAGVMQDGALKAWIERTLPALFHGCEVIVTTPLHYNRGIVEPDTRRWRYTA